MSLKDLKNKSDSALAAIPPIKREEQTQRRPVTAPGATAFMQPALDDLSRRAEAAEAKVLEYQSRGVGQAAIELPLDLLVEVPARRRTLTAEQLKELTENLRANPLVHPISIEPAKDGKYRIISGHNRVDAYRALGRSGILAVVRDIEAEKVERAAFYANLLQPSLPDYEKYLGFKREQEATGKTQKQMAGEAGVPESVLSMLFSFEQLPGEALQLIARRPGVVGMSCAAELAKLSKGKQSQARVLEALERLVEGGFSQKEAVRYASAAPALPRAQQSVAPIKVRSGRKEYCQYVGRGTSLRIEFKEEAHRRQAEEEISQILNRLATRLTPDSKF